ncbi:MAG: PAS domain S-box protein [Pseudomonadota bacterium]
MIGATGYLSRKHWEETDARIDETRRIAALKSANAASRAFGDLKYWLTDASLSLLLRSQHKAEEARKKFEAELKTLQPLAPRAIAEISYELRSLLGHAAKAVDAYTRNRRVLGNSLMARMRVSMREINDRLTSVVNRLEAEAVAESKASVQDTRRAVIVSFSIVLLATLFGIVLTAFVLSSVQTRLVERDQQAAQRREVERALSHSDARLNSIFENSPAVIFLMDTEGRYVHVNRRFEEVYGFDRESILGKTVGQVF